MFLECAILIIMSRKKQHNASNVTVIELFSFIVSLMYMQSVLTVAHHTSMWVHNGTTYTVEAPSVPLLVAGLLAVAYGTYKNKFAVTTMNAITITIFMVSSIFWLSGLRTNFYF